MASFTDQICILLDRSPKTDVEIAAALGVSKQTVSAWRNGTRSPKKPMIKTISRYFGVGIPWLLGVSDDMTECVEIDENELTEIEARIISDYRQLNADGQRALLDYCDYLRQTDKYKKDTAKAQIS